MYSPDLCLVIFQSIFCDISSVYLLRYELLKHAILIQPLVTLCIVVNIFLPSFKQFYRWLYYPLSYCSEMIVIVIVNSSADFRFVSSSITERSLVAAT